MLSGCLEMGCWMIEADAFYETQLFYRWSIGLITEASPGTVVPSQRVWILWDKALLQRRVSKHRRTAPPCRSNLPTPTSQTRERLMVTESLQACWELTISPRSQLLLEADLELKYCLASPLCGAAPSDGDHVASISSCTTASSAKGGDDRAWLCSPQQVKALGGTSILHWQAGRFLALSMRLLPSEVYCVWGHLSRLFMSCYTHHSLLRLAHLHRVLRAIS